MSAANVKRAANTIIAPTNMSLIDRIKNIIVSPRTEWPRIAEEPATVASLYTGYILILAAIGPVALLLSRIISVSGAIVQYLLVLALTYLAALVIDALAPPFGGEKGFLPALKLAAYSMTPIWVAEVLYVVRGLLALVGLLAILYGVYLFYVGVPVLKKVPRERVPGYAIVVIVCIIVLWYLLTGLIMRPSFGLMMMPGRGWH